MNTRCYFLLLMAMAFVTTSGVARDSTWLLCSSESLAVSLHEHRDGADGRETSLTLIFGVHQMHGALRNKDSGQVRLDSATRGADTNFTGKVSVDYDSDSVVLNGTLKIDGEPTKVNATMQCKEMSGELD